jgi:hypothetical protein
MNNQTNSTYSGNPSVINTDMINKAIELLQDKPVDIFQQIALKHGFNLDKGDKMILPSKITPNILRGGVISSDMVDNIILLKNHSSIEFIKTEDTLKGQRNSWMTGL